MSTRVEPSSSARRLRCGLDLARMRTQRVHLWTQRATATGEGIEGHRRGQIGRGHQVFESRQREHGRGQHLRGAVVEGKAFLERQPDRFEPARFSASAPLTRSPSTKRFAAAEQDDRQMRQRCEVAAGADRTLGRDQRNDAAIEQGGQRFERRHANAGMAAQQRIDADRQHRAHDLGIERRADADRMRDQQVVLQLLKQGALALLGIAAGQFVARAMGAEQLVGIAAEAGGHAVDRLAATDLFGEEIGRALHALQAPPAPATRRRRLRAISTHLGAGQRGAIEHDRHGLHLPSRQSARVRRARS